MTGKPCCVARFLSAAWFDQFTEAGAPGDRPGLQIQQVVTDGPDGDVRYHVHVAEGSVAVQVGAAARPDVTFTEDYASAVAVAQGELTVQGALLDGRIQVAGDMGALIACQEDLAVLDPIPAAVRAATTF
jgi:putative sterol carrier protein